MVFSDFVYLLLLGACLHQTFTVRDLESCEITPTTLVGWPPMVHRGNNKAHDILVRSSIVKTVGSSLGEFAWKLTWAWGRPIGYPLSYSIGISVLARGSNEDYRGVWASRYLRKIIITRVGIPPTHLYFYSYFVFYVVALPLVVFLARSVHRTRTPKVQKFSCVRDRNT
jgi:hypothetical protein